MGRQFKPGQLQTGSLYNISSSYALTASFALNGGGGGISTGSFVTTSSFNAFTASYTTGSFTGSFIGTLTGTSSFATTASYVRNAVTASYVNPLNQNVQLTGSLYLSTPGVASVYFSGSAAASRLVWNNTDGTLDLGLKGGNVTLQVGQESVILVVNKTGANLLESEYKAVRIRRVDEGGAQGQRLAIVLAQADNDANSVDTLGLVTENIDVNQEGFITSTGLVRNINTTGASQGESWADGDVLYLSPTTPGAITKVKPQGPQHTVILGYVVYAHATAGKIFVKVDNGYEIDELHNVKITTGSLTAGQLLVRSGSNATGVWINTNQLTGSYGLTGSLTATSFTGTLTGTASWASNAVTASYVQTAQTASYVLQAVSSSFATSASYAPDTTFPYSGSARITGSLGVTGSISLLATTSTTSTIFNVRNSADTANIIETRGNASIVFANGVSTYSLNPRTDADGFSLNSGNGLYGTGTGMEVVSNGFLINNSGTRTFRFTGASVTNLWEFRNESNQLRICPTTDTTDPIVNLNGTTRFVGVGILTPAARLDVKAQGALSTDIAFRVRNSADTADLISFRGNGSQWIQSVPFIHAGNLTGGTNAAQSLYVGYNASVTASTGTRNTIIGTGTGNSTNGNEQTAIGWGVSTGGFNTSIAIGAGATLTANNQCVIGSETYPFSTLQIGTGGTVTSAAAVQNMIFSVGGVAGGYTSNTDLSSKFFRIQSQGGSGTGNGAPIQFSVAPSGSGGFTANTFVIPLEIRGDAAGLNHYQLATPRIPTSSLSDGYIQYSADRNGVAGKASPHFRTEDGTIVWLGDESRLFNVTASNMMVGVTSSLALFTSQNITANIGTTTIYAFPTASYEGAFIDYTARSGSNARAGQIMGIWSGSAVNFTETTTTDFGSTTGLTFGMSISASSMIVSASATSAAWTVKTIIRSI
jgi:hypothetical protein